MDLRALVRNFFQELVSIVVAETVGTDVQPQEIDLGQIIDKDISINLSVKTTNNAVAPGTPKTVTVNLYWSDEQITPSSGAAAILLGRKQAATALAIVNTANAVRQYDLSINPIKVKAQWLYITFDNTVLAAGATIALKVNATRVR